MVLGGMGFLILFLAVGLTGAIQSQRLLMDLSRDSFARATLADQFRSDVSASIQASGPPDDKTRTEDQLLLQRPDGGTTLFSWRGNPGGGYSLVREENPPAGKKMTRILVSPRDGLRGSFLLVDQATLAGLQLIEIDPKGKPSSGLVIFAAVGGVGEKA
ncbi:MAG: hypothetical protein ACKO23_00475 [Gemmataceae bacterium]